MVRDGAAVVVHREHVEYFVEERTLRGGPPGIGIEQGAGEVLGHGDRWDRQVIGVGQRCHIDPPACTGDTSSPSL